MSNNTYDGFELLEQELSKYIDNTNNVNLTEELGKAFVKDLLKLPKPMSKIRKSGYTHLIDTFSYRNIKSGTEVGWGKYYGPMVENGTIKMAGRPHLKPLWEKNKEKYYSIINNKIFN